MKKPRLSIASIFRVAMLGLLFSLPSVNFIHAQQQQAPPDSGAREQGIKLYEAGDLKGAIKVFRVALKERKDDADAWYYLGAALYRSDNIKEAREAFEKAIELKPKDGAARTAYAYTLLLTNKLSDAKREAEQSLALNPANAEAHYLLGVLYHRQGEYSDALRSTEAALKISPQLPQALLLKSQVLVNIYFFEAPLNKKAALSKTVANPVSLRLKDAADSLEQYLKLQPGASDAKLWREQMELLRLYVDKAAGNDLSGIEAPIGDSKELTTKARIVSRPEPQYTHSARQARISGTVVLRAVFDIDGKVKRILVAKALSHGLTEEAVKAARGIKFEPATKDGRKVPQYIQIEYNFNVY